MYRLQIHNDLTWSLRMPARFGVVLDRYCLVPVCLCLFWVCVSEFTVHIDNDEMVDIISRNNRYTDYVWDGKPRMSHACYVVSCVRVSVCVREWISNTTSCSSLWVVFTKFVDLIATHGAYLLSLCVFVWQLREQRRRLELRIGYLRLVLFGCSCMTWWKL